MVTFSCIYKLMYGRLQLYNFVLPIFCGYFANKGNDNLYFVHILVFYLYQKNNNQL